jgi:hypothetical protein
MVALLNPAGLIFLGFIALLVIASMWLLVAGDRAQDIEDKPTLDVQNHIGD